MHARTTHPDTSRLTFANAWPSDVMRYSVTSLGSAALSGTPRLASPGGETVSSGVGSGLNALHKVGRTRTRSAWAKELLWKVPLTMSTIFTPVQPAQ